MGFFSLMASVVQTLPKPPLLSLSYGSPAQGTVGEAYSITPTATGQSLVYTKTSGTLPSGTTLNASTGTISGTPDTAATYGSIVIRATDDFGAYVETTISITIVSAAPTSVSLRFSGTTSWSVPSGWTEDDDASDTTIAANRWLAVTGAGTPGGSIHAAITSLDLNGLTDVSGSLYLCQAGVGGTTNLLLGLALINGYTPGAWGIQSGAGASFNGYILQIRRDQAFLVRVVAGVYSASIKTWSLTTQIVDATHTLKLRATVGGSAVTFTLYEDGVQVGATFDDTDAARITNFRTVGGCLRENTELGSMGGIDGAVWS